MKKKLLSTAIAAGMGMGLMSTAAQAVYVNAQGTGQVLLYPYYSAENGNDTYVQVVNTSNVGKVVKVRFLESKNSQEVLDFNLYLSANDVWAGAVTATANGGAKIVTSDTSCTDGTIPADGQPFVNFQYDGDGDSSIERTAEGHVEIIGMADIIPGSDLDQAIDHGTAGVPADCSYTNGKDFSQGGADAAGNVSSFGSTGDGAGLYGFSQLVNVEQGVAAKMDATALANFSTNNLWTDAGSVQPDLTDANTSAVIFDGTGVTTVPFADFLPPAGEGDPVSAVLMTQNIQNSYVVEPDINAGTDWIVTFPTKGLYVNGTNAPEAPFTTAWDSADSNACEPVSLSYWDREEQQVQSSVEFSPPPPTGPGASLCYEANVVTFNNADVIGSANTQNVDVAYTAGWMDIAFTAQSFTTDPASTNQTFNGLPAIGYSVVEYANGTIGGVVRNYSGASKHKETAPY